MKLDICIEKLDDGYVLVTEHTDGEQYLPENSALTAKNRFSYSETAAVDIFRLNATTGTSLTTGVITLREEGTDAKVPLNRDGWFTAIHMVIPTQQWVYNELSKQGSIINIYDTVYFTDGKAIYTCKSGEISNSSISAMIEETSTNTTISRVDANYVSIGLLTDSLIDLYQALFEERMYNGGCNIDACEANRILSIINLIKHYTRWGQLAEAERVIEKANYFNTSTTTSDTSKNLGCGCL